MKILKQFKSRDGKTIKFLQKTRDYQIIETGYYNLDEHIICLSSQVGCPMGCIFCATTKPIDKTSPDKIFIRNLTSREIVQQAKNILHLLQKQKKLKKKNILFSFMGAGEPFSNYKNVLNSINILSKEFPNSRTTIATVGASPSLIKKLAKEKINTVLKLHLSLHAPNDVLRKKILPKAGKIKAALEALNYFSKARNTPAKVNYILINNLNDSQEQALQLAKLLKQYPFTVKLSNLNNFNNLITSNKKKIKIFEKILNNMLIKTCRFNSTGTDILAGCGQLRRRYYGNNKNTPER